MGKYLDALMALVVVGDFDVEFQAVFPSENNPPLLVDSDAPVTGQIPLKLFEAISRWNEKILHNPRLIDHAELATGTLLDVARQFGNPKPGVDLLSVGIAEALDHLLKIPYGKITSSVMTEKTLLKNGDDAALDQNLPAID
jgi:hypothetical protein